MLGFTAVGSLGGAPGMYLGLIVGGCVGGFIEDNVGTMIDGDEEPTEADAVGACAAGAVSATLLS